MARTAFSGMLNIDPVTRIEGHLKIQTEVNNGRVTKAWSSSQLFRGIETIVKNRAPENVHHYVQRVCGVCTNTHALASIRAVENAADITPPPTAELIRQLILSTLMIQDHVVHFYVLSAMDFMDLQSATTADPVATARIASELAGYEVPRGEVEILLAQLKKFVASGQLGFIANADFLGGHPSYNLSPEENLVMACNYMEAIRVQIKLARANAIFSSKNPHSQTMRVGGVTCYDALRPESLEHVRVLLHETSRFVTHNYKGDVYLLGKRYPEVATYGGASNFYDVDEFYNVETHDKPFFKGGVMWKSKPGKVEKESPAAIAEDVTRSWYEPSPPLNPYEGKTIPDYTTYNLNEQYSWSKAPRYNGEPMETGPLARRLMAYARNEVSTKKPFDQWLQSSRLKPENMNSTLGRIAARMIETNILMQQTPLWLQELTERAKAGSPEIYKEWKLPDKAQGVGFSAVSRGALSHWIRIEKGTTANYQMVVPSTWNLGPRCAHDKASPLEEALLNVPVIDPERPTDIIRTVHSLDPCVACAVHLIEGEESQSPQKRHTITIR